MADINGMFPSTWLKAADLQGRRITLQMAHVKVEEVADEKKPVLYFIGAKKGLVLNVTNANTIKDLYGSETEHWRGQAITLFVTKVEYQGRRTDGIRVDAPDNPALSARPPAAPVPIRQVAQAFVPLPAAPSPDPFLSPEETLASGPMPNSDDIPF